MDRTTAVAAVVALASLLCAAHALVCWRGVGHVCVLSPASSVVSAILAGAMLLPTSACLVVAWLDARQDRTQATRNDHEKTHLLPNADAEHLHSPRVHPRRVVAYLYCGQTLSDWGDRMWQFAVPILFMDIFVDTLLPSACFSLAMYTACMLVIPSVGKLLDRWDRWTAMKVAIVVENLMIVLSSALLVTILVVTDADGMHKPAWSWPLLLLFSATLVCGCIGQVLNNAQTIGVQRDWVVVIAGKDSARLTQLNTTVRRIDLLCLILGPLAFGVIMDFAGKDPKSRALTGAAVVGIWNAISTPLEYAMTHDIYKLVPELASKDQTKTKSKSLREGQAKPSSTEGGVIAQYLQSWGEYAQHPIFLLSFSFCLLYMTVLSGGALNVAYLKWRNVPASLLGLTQGAGAISGLLGTLAFPYLRSWIGRLESAVVWCVAFFWLALAPVLLAFVFLGESTTTDILMMVCVAFSRMWLWCTDLAETQLMQEWVESHERGLINAMQTATSQFFFILILVVGIVFHDPRDFEVLVFSSVAAVLASVIGTIAWFVRCGRHRRTSLTVTSSEVQA